MSTSNVSTPNISANISPTRVSSERITQLRAKHPQLTYQSYSIQPSPGFITITYNFILEPNLTFSPTIDLPTTKEEIDPITDRIVFLLGLVELISYWKLSCPEKIEIRCGFLTEVEKIWWKDLYRKGLGEFFYINAISPNIPFDICVDPLHQKPMPLSSQLTVAGTLVLVGGGKDSIVTLEALSDQSFNSKALCVNPIQASLDAIREAGYGPPLVVSRVLDSQLNKLNQLGYMNGHTPYSALLAFVSVLVAHLHGIKFVLASNETSASEGNASIDGIEVNHQYSKSIDFERRFREYPFGFTPPAEYLSFLRPLNELQICAIFSQQKSFHTLFRSCNQEQTQKARARQALNPEQQDLRRIGWCGECPKCVFTCISLACFLTDQEICRIFGVSPFQSTEFVAMAKKLAGHGEHKPFECVGTYEEVRSALAFIAHNLKESTTSLGLAHELKNIAGQDALSLSTILKRWDKESFLPPAMENILKDKLSNALEGLRR